LDPFASLGEKFRFLLQLSAGARVVVHGPYWTALSEDLKAAGLNPVPPGLNGARIDAWFIELGGWGAGVLEPAARSLASASTLVALRRRGWAPDRWSRHLVHRIVHRAGLKVAGEFIPLPQIETPEAFLAAHLDPVDWIFRGSRIRTLLSLDAPADRLFLVAHHAEVPGFKEASALLARASGETGFVVERFHLRRRGALVMGLNGPDRAARILRVATNPRVAALTRRNHEVTEHLHGTAAFPEAVRHLIPRPLGRAVGEGVEAWAETLLPGRLAWMLYQDPQCETRIDRDLFRFTHAFQTATCRRVALDGENLQQLLQAYFEPIERRLGNRIEIGNRLLALRQRLHILLLGRTCSLAAAHGDFGVGNALATRTDGVTAVIDWDQFLPVDFAGVDWCDYRFKARHHREPVLDALPRVIASATASGSLAGAYSGFGAEFGFDQSDMAIIPCFGLLRELTRAAGFPGELRKPDSYYVRLLDLVGANLPGAA
jgi:hypothetical protein